MGVKIDVYSSTPPALARIVGKGLFLIQPREWIKVPDDTKYEDLNWINKIKDYGKRIVSPIKEYKVTGSDGVTIYTVKFTNGVFHCTCVGYSYRRECHHVDKVKLEVNEKSN